MKKSPREAILKRISEALKNQVEEPYKGEETQMNWFEPAPADLDITFAEAFSALQGRFAFCANIKELVGMLKELAAKTQWDKWFCNDETLKRSLVQHGWDMPWYNQLAHCHVALTRAEVLVARTGTMVLSSAASGGRTPSVFAPAHICIAYTEQLVYDLSHAMEYLANKYGDKLPSNISFASGPSRTADIEKTLVTGVHGPKEVFCFLLDQ